MTPILLFALFFNFVLMQSFNSDALDPYSDDDIGEPPTFPEQSDIIDPERLWPNQTVVYSFERLIPASTLRHLVLAMVHIMGRTCIKFRTKEENDTDYIYLNPFFDYCGSKVGRIGGLQELWLPTNCATFRSALHELVHAIGFYHEHQRTDRDQYVIINWENIQENKTQNFAWLNDSFISSFGVPYDYKSIMHYTFNNHSANGNDTITPMDPDVTHTIGNIPSLSDYDIKKINAMYCPGTQGIRIQSVLNGEDLTVEHGVVKTANWSGSDNQKWTTNWDSLRGLNDKDGSYLKTWSPVAFGFEVLALNTSGNALKLMEYDALNPNQNWNLVRKQNVENTQWMLVVGLSPFVEGCLVAAESQTVRILEDCDLLNPSHLWKIYNV